MNVTLDTCFHRRGTAAVMKGSPETQPSNVGQHPTFLFGGVARCNWLLRLPDMRLANALVET